MRNGGEKKYCGDMKKSDPRFKLVKKLCYFEKGRFKNARLYSPRATISIDALQDTERQRLCKFMTSAGSRSGLRVIRTIGDDGSLVDLLGEELQLRGAAPYQENNNKNDGPWWSADSNKHIVLITERDTLYGQAFRESFRQLWGSDNDPPENLHQFTYLRGIDGKYPHSERLEDQPRDGPDEESVDELAHGTAQLDYLRRLEREIVDLQKEKSSENAGEIAAIGIAGTDVFDKMLIIRAMLPHFPRARFFTTDLDARLAQQDELQYTRNLLVASHFALDLDRETFHRTVPPFRDSYQTSTYFATRLGAEERLPTDIACSNQSSSSVYSWLWPSGGGPFKSARFMSTRIPALGRQ